jgi:hypothetical protein
VKVEEEPAVHLGLRERGAQRRQIDHS